MSRAAWSRGAGPRLKPLSVLSSETSKVDYVLFQAATAVMEAVVREWILLEKGSIESLRTFLLTYVLQRPK